MQFDLFKKFRKRPIEKQHIEKKVTKYKTSVNADECISFGIIPCWWNVIADKVEAELVGEDDEVVIIENSVELGKELASLFYQLNDNNFLILLKFTNENLIKVSYISAECVESYDDDFSLDLKKSNGVLRLCK